MITGNTTYSAFTYFLTAIASGHTSVNSVGIGESDDYSQTGEDDYPRVFIELPIRREYSDNTFLWKLSLMFTDQTGVDRINEQEKINLCGVIMDEVIEAYKNPEIITSAYTIDNNVFSFQDAWNAMTITRTGDDVTAGWRTEISFLQRIPVSVCDITNVFNTGI